MEYFLSYFEPNSTTSEGVYEQFNPLNVLKKIIVLF